MRVWRICRKSYVDTALDGIVGMYTSGRWHSKGNSMVYTASSAALAALEVLVHVDPLTAPTDLRAPRKIIKTLDSGVISFMFG